jgi:hypothetical protein
MRRLVPAILAAAAALATATTAHAEPPPMPTTELNAEARAQYNQGREALNDGRYVEAALHFERATSRTPHAVSWYMAAEAWRLASRPERAADALSRALDVPGLTAELDAQVRARLKALEGSLGTVVFGGPSSFRASLDGSTAVSPPARLHALPGTHVVTIQPPDRAPSRREVTLVAGAEIPMVLAYEEEETPPPSSREPKVEVRIVERVVPRPAEPRKYAGFGLLGRGVASSSAAVVLGASALDARDAYVTSRTQSAYDHVRTVQAWANVATAVGIVFVGAGAALVLWPTEDHAKTPAVGIGFGSAAWRGTF